MSLTTDIFFYHAIKDCDEIYDIVDGRIFNPARATADEEEDKVPYIIISFDGLQNISESKDDVEGEEDNVQISILCVSNDRDSLGELTEIVRKQVRDYYNANIGNGEAPEDWHFEASQVSFDPDKPCCYQTLIYQCSTIR